VAASMMKISLLGTVCSGYPTSNDDHQCSSIMYETILEGGVGAAAAALE